MSGRLSAATGTLYDGTKSELTYSGRWGVVPRFSIEPGVTLNWVQLPYGDFTARLVSARFTVTPTARMLISSLVQFNVDQETTSSSVRLRWEYTGGSELFVVYSDGRDTTSRRVPRSGQSHGGDQGDAAVPVLSAALAGRAATVRSTPASPARSRRTARPPAR